MEIAHDRGTRARRRGDRLLRNSAIACAILLAILALGNIDEPWAQKASESIERAVNMRINLDGSIGELSFVRQIMPESALAFFHFGESGGFRAPVSGDVTHAWTQAQPWIVYACESGAPVRAASDGTVTAVSKLSGGQLGVLIDHGEGVETLYAGLSEADVLSGDSVLAGQALGSCSGSVYFEYREYGASVEPPEGI